MLRAGLAFCALLCTAAGLAGCSNAHQGGFERDVVVSFQLPAGDFNPPAASVADIQKNCPGGPHAVPLPIPPSNAPASSRLFGIRFNVAGADDATISALEACLYRQPLVKTAQLEDEDS